MLFQQIKKTLSSLLILLVMTSMLMQSCVPQKDLVSLNGNETLPKDFKSDRLVYTTEPQKFQPYKIQPFDQLLVKVNALEGSTEQFLNREFDATNGGQQQNFDPAALYFSTYTVDEKGFINLPIVEKIQVKGLSVSQIKERIDETYKPYLKFASSTVKMASNRITVMGEVNNPGVHYLYNDQNTIIDAISIAGDFTDFGNRKKVKIIRRTDEGLSTIYINMHRSEFIYSPYYYLQPYDVIYVEPTKMKSKDTGANSTGVILSGISVGVLILNLLLNK